MATEDRRPALLSSRSPPPEVGQSYISRHPHLPCCAPQADREATQRAEQERREAIAREKQARLQALQDVWMQAAALESVPKVGNAGLARSSTR